MSIETPPPAADPKSDLLDQLKYLLGVTGGILESDSAIRIKIYHTRAFPWDDVLKLLLYRNYKVNVTCKKADLFIEAALPA
jgi:hypothetical protein